MLLVSATTTTFETVTLFSNGNSLVMTRGDAPRRAYYPGVPTISQAQAISVRAGEERSATDFTVVPTAMAKLSVRFVDVKGNPVEASASIASADASTSGAMARSLMMMGPNTSTSL